jgi:imidazolonepropionase-like amidohydrolase
VKRLLLCVAVGIAVLAACVLVVLELLRPPALRVPERQDWVFRDVTLVEAGRAPRVGRTLRIVDGRIAEDAAITSEAGSPGDGGAPDLAGLFVAPGLIDMHVHYPPKVAAGNAELWSLLLLAHGVTSIRETGSIDGGIFEVREAIGAGLHPGPRVFACGSILDGAPPSFPSNRVVRTPDDARAAVLEQAAAGADCLKAYNMLSPEALTAIRETAAKLGLPVIGHAPHSVPLAEAGLADLQHGTGAVPIDRERVGLLDFRFEDWARLDAERIAYTARISRAQSTAHTPTLVNARMRRLLVAEAATPERIASDTGLRHLPRFWPAVWATLWSAPWTPGDADARQVYRLFQDRLRQLSAELHAAGVQIHAGTDTLMPFVAPGSSLHGELADLASAGIPVEDVWRIATHDAGRWLGLSGLGRLEAGAPADLLFLRRNPRNDLSALGEIEAVLANGRLYRRAALDEALGRYDAHFHGRIYETLMGVFARLLQGQFAPESGEREAS